jgi:hypothetical protein
MKLGLISSPETSVLNSLTTRNNPEEGKIPFTELTKKMHVEEVAFILSYILLFLLFISYDIRYWWILGYT